MSVTAYGRVVSIESTGPPEIDPPEGEILEATRAMRDLMPAHYLSRAIKWAEPREGEEEPKLWVHVHILLDAPHSGELQVNALESQVSAMLAVDGRARVTISSN